MSSNNPYPTLFRRLAAFVYDGFILFSFLLLATLIALLINGGEDFKSHQLLFSLYLFLSSGLFVSWFWQRSGQTLGMLAWRIKVVDQNQQLLTWPKAFFRYCLSVIFITMGGIGFLWCLFDKEKQTLYDKLICVRLINAK